LVNAGQKAPKVSQDETEPLANMGQKAQPVNQWSGHKESKVTPGNEASQELSDLKAPKGNPDRSGVMACQGWLAETD
jgi:hypothetical protein